MKGEGKQAELHLPATTSKAKAPARQWPNTWQKYEENLWACIFVGIHLHAYSPLHPPFKEEPTNATMSTSPARPQWPPIWQKYERPLCTSSFVQDCSPHGLGAEGGRHQRDGH